MLQGYPYSGSGVGVYSPLKLDLGGLVIGAIIGIGALLIVPKLVGAFQGGYGGSGNYRSIFTINKKPVYKIDYIFLSAQVPWIMTQLV